MLKSKLPEGQHIHDECNLEDVPLSHPVKFDSLDASLILSMVLRTTGAAGPCGVEALGWRKLCTSFQGASKNLCNSLAVTVKRICTTYVHPEIITPILVSRLIALDKVPGVRSIGIRNTARLVISKVVLSIAKPDIQEDTGCQQLCGGQILGIEAAVHGVQTAFEEDDNEAIFLVNASNTFNTLKYQVALQNIRRLCPPLGTHFVNSYRALTDFYIDGEVFHLQESTTQGDPLVIPMYMPLPPSPSLERLMENPRRFGTQTMPRLWAQSLTFESGGTSSPPLVQTLAIMPIQ